MQFNILSRQKLSTNWVQRMYFNVIHMIYNKSTGSIILNSERLKIFPLRSKIRPRVPTLTNAIQHNIGCSSQSNQERKINERHQIRKESKIISVVRT